MQQDGTGLPHHDGCTYGGGCRTRLRRTYRERERREREEERIAEAEELGAEIKEPLFLPMPAFMASAEEQ
jgi:hypothetical protein